jgi:hypothetical protein
VIVALHRQAAAFLWPIQREGGDDGVAAGFHALMQLCEIGVAVAHIDQEMERGAIVPDVEGLRWLPFRHVGCDPLH